MITLKQILAQFPPEDWFASVDLKDAYFHIQIAPHHRRFLRFAFEGTAYQYSALPFGLALVNRTFSKCKNAVLIPPQSEWDARSQLSGRLADFSSVPGPTHQPCRHVASSLGVSKAICQHTEEHSFPESVYNISGSVLRLGGDASLPLSEELGGHFVFPLVNRPDVTPVITVSPWGWGGRVLQYPVSAMHVLL